MVYGGSAVAGSAKARGAGPIIIVGTGRCGSTLLHRLLARHEGLGWLSTYNEVLPTQTWLSVFSRLYRLPLPERIKSAKAFPKPFEAYRFWEHYLPGFSRRDRPQTAADVIPRAIEPVRHATARVLRSQGRRRLLVKVTGWSRIAYFDRIYPDALFLSLRRDPRSVVSSWIKAGWLDVTSSPGSEEWQWGEVRPELYELWRDLGGDPLLSAALKIRLDLDDIARNMAMFPGRCHELWYEDLIHSPEITLRDVCEFCGLDWTPSFEGVIGRADVYDPTGKWMKHLSEEQGALVLEFLRRADELEGPDAHVVSAMTRAG
jgi:sulfotransferase family protein